ncbi:type IV secretory system conjugative DNA transfer family protein [Rufibacter quisquiliarum]|uniref:Type IV secretion system protein VirD4 n=1 Tax=Rufibacter quisquiliarum TaxID=1549639 RepID=A0A839GNR5_9BACT|nr:type IV secretory system conjugative DNA transfer family protein [Rufibacter quisquiliarum]MBA9076557.1 type IV secretion system protein VirD4 [Rufibacter quisquiliarum]
MESHSEVRNKALLFLIGMVLLPVTLAGVLWGYARGYKRFVFPLDRLPVFARLPAIVKLSMLIGAVLIWAVLVVLAFVFYVFVEVTDIAPMAVLTYLGVNLVLSFVVYFFFVLWRHGVKEQLVEGNKFGSARLAREHDLVEYKGKSGFYIGGGYTFADKGHILTVAGTRGGKGTNLIIPNLLGLGGYEGSWVVIDPKGENAAITARYQFESGKELVVLNPWGLLQEQLGKPDCYNPLDLLADKTSLHLVDDAQMIAEMLVPVESGDKNKFFTDTARSIIAGIILQIAVTQEAEDRSLRTLWKWVRYTGDQWLDLIAEMQVSDDEANGEVIRNAGNEIKKLMEGGEETFGNIISSVLQATDFLKSPALDASMRSGVDPYSIADGNTALYIIIPADKLQSHSRWLRLVVTSILRAAIRKPNKRVCFLLDEFAALGYLPEIEIALSTYAGYEVTVWPILQSLIQLKNLYAENWESFTANSTIRHFFSVNDNFTAEYVSKTIGQTSHLVTNKSWFRVIDAKSNSRDLVTPDELRRSSGENIFAFMGSKPPTYFPKRPYYLIPELIGKADRNPYL